SPRGSRGRVASSSVGSLRSSAPPSGPRRCTGKRSSDGDRSTAVAHRRVEHHASPGPQLPAVRRRHRPHDGRGGPSLSPPRPHDFHRDMAGLGGERPSVVVANSHWTADLARSVLEFLGCRALAADVRVVPLGTTPSRFRPGIDSGAVRRRYGLDGGPWLLTVARLDFHKGIDTVIRALPAIRADFPTARYAVVGIGSRRSSLERLVAELGLGEAVRLLGFVPDEDLPALYNAADGFVLASRRYDL